MGTIVGLLILIGWYAYSVLGQPTFESVVLGMLLGIGLMVSDIKEFKVMSEVAKPEKKED
jgi:hypothetical protein